MSPQKALPDKLSEYTQRDIATLSQERFTNLAASLLRRQREKRQTQQLLYYQPSTSEALKVHLADTRYVGVGGGNGSSKTETCLVELLARCTGVIPYSLRDVGIDWQARFRGPMHGRMIVESLTTTLENIILPKMQWWNWTGLSRPGGPQGHYGWIPRSSLIQASWDKSYSQKLRTLSMYCRDPEQPQKILGESSIQFMAHNQDPSDFASGDFDFVLFDEPSRYSIFRENQARTMRVAGNIFLAMTWPDDPEIAVDWIFDEFYDRAQPGPAKSPNYTWINLYTTDNPHLDQNAVAEQSSEWSEQTKLVRIYGQPIRFSKRVHPLFADQPQWWCYTCRKVIAAVGERCPCGSADVGTFCHVATFDHSRSWPTVFLLDPHPRKPHMGMWIQIDPSDNYEQIDEIECAGTAEDLAADVYERERELDLNVVFRFMDPNMRATGSRAGEDRDLTWQDEFDMVGLPLALANDSRVGRGRVNRDLEPDRATQRPVIRIHSRCTTTIHQFKRYVWEDWRLNLEKAEKQVPKAKDDDYPTLWKYFENQEMTFTKANFGSPVMRHGAASPVSSRVRRRSGRTPSRRRA
jgi:hypothetical protein